ncbi:MAG: hypothetical protein BHV70_01570 [Bacteroidales bacterium 55_9]|nr:MAG: hypothetical protein BHV70_01570 [Bacteroidales bacterium 55_9]
MMGEENKVSSVQETGGGKRIAPAEKSRSAGKTAGLVIGIVLGVLVLGYGAACAAAQMVYGHAALPNTTVLGLDVSGMSAQEAEQLWQEKGAAALESTAIDLTRDGRTVGSVTLAELGVTVKPLYISRAAGCDSASDHPLTVVESGWELLRSYLRPTDVTPQLDVDGAKLTDTCETLADTLDCTLVDGSYRLENGQGLYITKPRDGEKLDGGALRTLLEQRLAARDLSPAECVYRERQAAALDVQALHDELEGKTVSAVCDKSTGRPTQSHVGVTFDVAAVQSQLDAAAPGAEFLADAEVQFPAVTTEELETAMFRDVLGTSTTKCAGPWGRHQNIRLAAKAINGNIYNPGEEFWYNAAVGQRTEARGFQPAAAYSGGRTATSIGGGICQVSSTLYYATLLSDLKIVLRYAHMFDPGYMPVTGCDATVSWGGPDFAFRNDTDYPIKIVTSYNDDTNELTVTIMGTRVNDNYVVMTNQFLSYSEFKVVYKEDESVSPGDQVVDQYGHNGYEVRTYRNVYDGEGKLLRSTVEATSDYDRGDKIILVAPGELPA